MEGGEGFKPELKEDKEREDAILKFEIEMARLLKSARQAQGTKWLDNLIQSPYFDTEWVFVLKNLEPNQISPHTGGVYWKIELGIGYSSDYENPEKAGREISYYLTTEGELVKVELKEEDHLQAPPKMNSDIDLIKDILSGRWGEEQEEMSENLKLEVQMGQNGLPVPTEEIKWLNKALSEATIVERKG